MIRCNLVAGCKPVATNILWLHMCGFVRMSVGRGRGILTPFCLCMLSPDNV